MDFNLHGYFQQFIFQIYIHEVKLTEIAMRMKELVCENS